MTCPRCDRALEDLYRDGARFGHCPQCGGVWFDFEFLDGIAESVRKARTPKSGRLPGVDASPLRCPKCEGGLVGISQEKYPYHACIVGYGRWVDGGELPTGPRLSRRIQTLFRKFVEGGQR